MNFCQISCTGVAAKTKVEAGRQVKVESEKSRQMQGATNVKMAKHDNKWWKIKTRKEHSKHERDHQNSELGQDYIIPGDYENPEGTLLRFSKAQMFNLEPLFLHRFSSKIVKFCIRRP